MNGHQHSRSTNYWISIFLILLGALFLLQNLGLFYIGGLWDFWPLILIAIGFAKLFDSGFKNLFGPLVLVGVGFIALLANMNYIYWDDVLEILLPLGLILLGLRILLNHRASKGEPDMSGDSFSEDRADAVAVFGGKEMRFASENFQGGNVTVMFGGADIYLGDCKLSLGKNVIDVFVMFGGAEIYVPGDWNVVLKGIPIFGGFADERHQVSKVEEMLPGSTLVISGFVMFGGIEIKDAISHKKLGSA